MNATWEQIAAVLDVTEADARELLRTWADGQEQLYRHDVANGSKRPIGITSEQNASIVTDTTTA